MDRIYSQNRRLSYLTATFFCIAGTYCVVLSAVTFLFNSIYSSNSISALLSLANYTTTVGAEVCSLKSYLLFANCFLFMYFLSLAIFVVAIILFYKKHRQHNFKLLFGLSVIPLFAFTGTEIMLFGLELCTEYSALITIMNVVDALGGIFNFVALYLLFKMRMLSDEVIRGGYINQDMV